MSNSIWKTPDVKPEENKQIIFYAGGGHFAYMGWYYKKADMFGAWDASETQKWIYYDDLIAQADRAEKLEEENQAMRDEFEVWHGNYECVVEDKERLQKVVDSALEGIQYIMDYGYTDPDGHYEDLQSLYNKINQLIKGE